MLGFLKMFWPPSWFKFASGKVKELRDIGSMKARDRYLSIFYTWVICRLLEDYKVPDDKLSEYMREFEKDPDKVLKEWDMGKFGLTDVGYEVYPRDGQLEDGKS